MQLPRLGSHRAVQFNVTPLIDVVLLLIIFFLVSSHLAQQETQLELVLPEAQSGREPVASQLARVTIHLLADGTMRLGGASVRPAEVRDRLQAERQQTSDNLEVRIRMDRRAAFGQLEPLLVACAEAEVWNVSFAVTKRPTRERVP